MFQRLNQLIRHDTLGQTSLQIGKWLEYARVRSLCIAADKRGTTAGSMRILDAQAKGTKAPPGTHGDSAILIELAQVSDVGVAIQSHIGPHHQLSVFGSHLRVSMRTLSSAN